MPLPETYEASWLPLRPFLIMVNCFSTPDAKVNLAYFTSLVTLTPFEPTPEHQPLDPPQVLIAPSHIFWTLSYEPLSHH